MSEPDHTPGFYGKIPSQAAFAHERLPLSFVRPWENWLQASLRMSQRILGEDWLDTYLSSPIWRFVLQAEVCGKGAWAGVLMPSVDREGHCFPLTLATQIMSDQAQKKLLSQADKWFSRLERYILTTLADDFNLRQFDRSLQSLVPMRGGAGRTYLQRLLFSKPKTGQSLWQTHGDDRKTPDNKTFTGLPRPEAFIGLLTPHAPPTKKAPQQPLTPNIRDTPSSERTHAVCRQAPLSSGLDQARFQWRSWALTDVGLRREINEDAYLNKPEAGVWVVADGMGGHSAGDVASQTVTRRLDFSQGGGSLASLEQNTRATLHAINTELLDLAAQMGPGHVVGTTVVAMLASGDDCAALWAGDSRLYRHRRGTLLQLTVDHSMAVEMAKISQPLPEGYGDNIVTRALGADPVLELDRIAFKAQPGDYYLLCSDGLIKEIHRDEIEEIFNTDAPEMALRKMVDLALERQARDNVTVIVISVDPV